MKTLGNILWHIPFLGFITATVVYLLGLLFTATVVGAPVGLGLMEFGKFLFAPFGHAMVSRADLKVEQNKAWKTYSTIVMIFYFPLGLFLAFIVIFQIAALFLSIIGIPAALVLAKSLGTYFNPVNKICVSSAVAAEFEKRKGQAEVEKYFDPSEKNKQVQSEQKDSALTGIQTERSISIPTDSHTKQNRLMPAVAGGVFLVLVAGGFVYYKNSQKEEKLIVPQSLQQQGIGDANASGLEKYNGTWTDGGTKYEITYTGDSDRIKLRVQYSDELAVVGGSFLKYSGGKLIAHGDEKDFYKYHVPEFKLLANGELFHDCGECSPDITLKKTEKRIPQFNSIGLFSCGSGDFNCNHRIQLWQDSDAGIVGLVGYPVMEADTPTRFIENVKYNPSSGALRFQATYADPYISDGPGSVEPNDKDRSHNKLEFIGTLIGDTLKGTFTTYSDNKGAPLKGWKGKAVGLNKDGPNTNKTIFRDIAEWQEFYSFIPKNQFRDPM